MWLGYVIHAISTEIWWGNPLVNALRRRDRGVDGTVDQVWTALYVVWTTLAKFDLHAGNVKFNDVSNQQDATTFSFINLFNSALHVSGDKFAHPQEHFLIVYTAFGTMHRHSC